MAGLRSPCLGCCGARLREEHAVLALLGGGPQLHPGRFGAADLVALWPHADSLREARGRGSGGGEAARTGTPPPPARQMRLVLAGAARFFGARAPAGTAQPAALRTAGLQAAGRHVLRPLLPQVREPEGGSSRDSPIPLVEVDLVGSSGA